MSAQAFLLYLLAWSVVAFTPGPAVACAMSQATRFGLRSSFAGIAGIQAGHLVFFTCIALGLATLLATAGAAFTVLRLAGGLYLLYLGARALVSSWRRSGVLKPSESSPPPARHSLFLQGLAIQVTNPKALLFMSAFLPQFINPDRNLALQLGILAVTTILVDVAVLATYAVMAERGAKTLRGSRLSAWLERVLGAVLVCFGLRLIFTRK